MTGANKIIPNIYIYSRDQSAVIPILKSPVLGQNRILGQTGQVMNCRQSGEAHTCVVVVLSAPI